MKLNVVIFSKNRPYQLDGLLHTMFASYTGSYRDLNVSVIYKDTETAAAVTAGYKKLIAIYEMTEHNVSFLAETAFKEQTIKAVDPSVPYTMMLVDDIVFINSWNMIDVEAVLDHPVTLCHSLRLHSGITRCYPTNQTTIVPNKDDLVNEKMMRWDWTQHGNNGDWGYPMSCDGHVFRTKQLLSILNHIPFTSPNTLEASMATLANTNNSIRGLNKMSCYLNGSALVNIPANRVQHEFPNRAGTVVENTAETLAADYVGNNRRITYKPGFRSESAHQEAYELLR